MSTLLLTCAIALMAVEAHAQVDTLNRIVLRRADSTGVSGHVRRIDADSITIFDGRVESTHSRRAFVRADLLTPSFGGATIDWAVWLAFAWPALSEITTARPNALEWDYDAYGQEDQDWLLQTLGGALLGAGIGQLIDASSASPRFVIDLSDTAHAASNWRELVEIDAGRSVRRWRIAALGGVALEPARSASIEAVGPRAEITGRINAIRVLRRFDVDVELADRISVGAAAMNLRQNTMHAALLDSVGSTMYSTQVIDRAGGFAILAIGRYSALRTLPLEISLSGGLGVASMALERAVSADTFSVRDGYVRPLSQTVSEFQGARAAASLAADIVLALTDRVSIGVTGDLLMALGAIDVPASESPRIDAMALPLWSAGAGFIVTARF